MTEELQSKEGPSSLNHSPTRSENSPTNLNNGNGKENTSSNVNVLRGQEHSFLMDRSDVEQMENGLLELMDDFKKGKLHAFGGDAYLEQMDRVRDLQEKLAQLHFELEEENLGQRMSLSEDEQERKNQQKQEQLMKNLENLCSSIQNLQQHDNE